MDYWDLITYYIERDGVNPISVENLFHVYYLVYDNPDVFPTIDLSLWYDELRELTNDLILKGSLLCSSGNCIDGNECLTLASKICMILYDDLADWALQEYDNCCAVGTILINQAPDDLSGAGWSLTGPRNQNGSGYTVLNEMPCGEYTLTWKDVEGYYTPESSTQALNVDDPIAFSGVYISEEEEPSLPAVSVRISRLWDKCQIYVNGYLVKESTSAWDSGRWSGISQRIQKGENTFRFVVTINMLYEWYVEAKFEVRVVYPINGYYDLENAEIFSYEIYEEAPEGERFPINKVFERIETMTF